MISYNTHFQHFEHHSFNKGTKRNFVLFSKQFSSFLPIQVQFSIFITKITITKKREKLTWYAIVRPPLVPPDAAGVWNKDINYCRAHLVRHLSLDVDATSSSCTACCTRVTCSRWNRIRWKSILQTHFKQRHFQQKFILIPVLRREAAFVLYVAEVALAEWKKFCPLSN